MELTQYETLKNNNKNSFLLGAGMLQIVYKAFLKFQVKNWWKVVLCLCRGQPLFEGEGVTWSVPLVLWTR